MGREPLQAEGACAGTEKLRPRTTLSFPSLQLWGHLVGPPCRCGPGTPCGPRTSPVGPEPLLWVQTCPVSPGLPVALSCWGPDTAAPTSGITLVALGPLALITHPWYTLTRVHTHVPRGHFNVRTERVVGD